MLTFDCWLVMFVDVVVVCGLFFVVCLAVVCYVLFWCLVFGVCMSLFVVYSLSWFVVCFCRLFFLLFDGWLLLFDVFL